MEGSNDIIPLQVDIADIAENHHFDTEKSSITEAFSIRDVKLPKGTPRESERSQLWIWGRHPVSLKFLRMSEGVQK